MDPRCHLAHGEQQPLVARGRDLNEILEENLYRNRHGNPLILDTILLEKVVEQPNIRLLLNTAAHDVGKRGADEIESVTAFCSQNSTRYRLRAPLFCDASGDGVLGFLSGAAFRMGAESKDEFGEGFAPDESYGHLLGHSLYFYTKDVGTPIRFTAPSWALKDVTGIARYRKIGTNMQGCNFWWLEYGGRLDTIHETETIKWELWKVVYGRGCQPRDLGHGDALHELQRRLDHSGQILPGIEPGDPDELTKIAKISASTQLQVAEIPVADDWLTLDSGWAMLLPLPAGPCPVFGFDISADKPGTQRIELLRATKPGNFTPDELLEAIDVAFPAGAPRLEARFTTAIDRAGYHFIKLAANLEVRVRLSDARLTGILAVTSACNKRVATSNIQSPPENLGIDSFEFWLPQRRPEGRHLAMTLDPPLDVFSPDNVTRGPARPTTSVNAWVADPADPNPELTLSWPEAVRIGRVIIEFDPDWDHGMESVLMTHPEEVVPFMVRDFDVLDGDGHLLAEIRDHHTARFDHRFAETIETTRLKLRIHATHGAPAAVFRMRVLPLG